MADDSVVRMLLESNAMCMQVKRRFRNCQAGGGGRETFGGDDDLSDANGSENETKANESSSSLSGAGLDTDPDFTNELVS